MNSLARLMSVSSLLLPVFDGMGGTVGVFAVLVDASDEDEQREVGLMFAGRVENAPACWSTEKSATMTRIQFMVLFVVCNA